jgi:quercetin dioxygenase-like cupin family protein
MPANAYRASALAGVLALAVFALGTVPADAHDVGVGSTSGAPLRETVTVTADKPLPNLPGKRLVSLIVDYPPGASSAPHHHAYSAFIYVYVLSGEIRSQVDDEPARIYRPGETWFESPGAHHRVSANVSNTKPARLLAVFIVDAADEALVLPDGE